MSIPECCDSCGFYNNAKCLHDHGRDLIIGNCQNLHHLCPIKEDILDAKRFKVQYRGESFYLMVVEYEKQPWEIFVEHATKGQHSLQFMLASWDCNTRFVSMALKKYPLLKVIRQLEKSSRQKNDLPYIIAEKLKEWV